MRVLSEPITFDWDKGNIEKNLVKHNVTNKEAEEVFSNEPSFIFKDETHSVSEKRYMIWGTTRVGRKLSIVFTIRAKKVRVISARDLHAKERREYEKKIKTDTEV